MTHLNNATVLRVSTVDECAEDNCHKGATIAEALVTDDLLRLTLWCDEHGGELG